VLDICSEVYYTKGMTTTAATALRKLAAETDTALADLDQDYARLSSRHAANVSTLRHIDGQKGTYKGRQRIFTLTVGQTISSVQGKLDRGEIAPWDVESARKALDALDSIREQMETNRAQAEELDEVWEANGCWSRFFVVRGGHIHYDISYRRCSRTPTTSHGWTPELSGATEAEAVAQLGPLLCTVCFPSAPVEWTIGHEKPARCAGSGLAPKKDTVRRVGMRAYGECTGCGESSTLNPSTYAVRAHKPK